MTASRYLFTIANYSYLEVILMVQGYRERYQTIVNKLKEGNYKLIPQRLAIIRILARARITHPLKISILCYTSGFPGISQATVYRNIILIKSLGEVLEIGFAGGEPITTAQNHSPSSRYMA